MNRELKEILKRKFSKELSDGLDKLNREIDSRNVLEHAPQDIIFASKRLSKLYKEQDALSKEIKALSKKLDDGNYRLCKNRNSNEYVLRFDSYYIGAEERAKFRRELQAKQDKIMLKLSLEKDYEKIVTILAEAGIEL